MLTPVGSFCHWALDIVAGCRKSSQRLQAFQAAMAEKLPLGFKCLFEKTNDVEPTSCHFGIPVEQANGAQ